MKVALKFNDRFLCAEPDGRLIWDRPEIGPWETWELERQKIDDRLMIALKSDHGFYLRAEGGGGSTVDAKIAQGAGPWELWQGLGTLDSQAFQCWDGRHYLTCRATEVSAHADLPQAFELVIVEGSANAISGDSTWTGRVTADGPRLMRDGTPWFLKGASFFRGFEKFLLDVNLRPQLAQLADLGCNCVDTWSMYHYLNVNDNGLPAFNMFRRQGWQQRLRDYHDMLGEFGIGSLWVGFCDPVIVLPSLVDQLVVWSDLLDKLDGIDNCAAIILNNEHDAHDFNRVDRDRFPRPVGHVGICSSWGDGLPPTPHWDGFGYHHPRFWSKVVKDACVVDHPGAALGKFVLLDEPIRIDSRNDNRESAPRVMEQMARTATGSAAGIVFHSQNGKHAELLDGYTLERAQAFFGGLAGV